MILLLNKFIYSSGKKTQIQKISFQDPTDPVVISAIKFNDKICKSIMITKNEKLLYILMEDGNLRRIYLESFKLDECFKIAPVCNLYLSSVISSNFNGSIIFYQEINRIF